MSSGPWNVMLIRQAKEAHKILPKRVHEKFVLLINELKTQPEAPRWQNYGKLSDGSYHCHIKNGRPTYVVCWTADKKTKTIGVYYAGTHEKAPY